jgi:hypothetical protein
MKKPFEHASRFLCGNRTIAPLMNAVGRNRALLREVRLILPQNLAAHCLHASLEEGALVVVTDSPVWGARLRFLSPELQRSLPTHCGRVARVRIRVQPASDSPGPDHDGTARLRMSPSVARHLLDAAESASDDRIAAAFRRLAEGGRAGDQAVATKGRM